MALMTGPRAASRVGRSASTLRSWVRRGHLEPAVRVGERVLYDDLAVALCERDRRRRGPGQPRRRERFSA